MGDTLVFPDGFVWAAATSQTATSAPTSSVYTTP
jgi:hypothetical protein